MTLDNMTFAEYGSFLESPIEHFILENYKLI